VFSRIVEDETFSFLPVVRLSVQPNPATARRLRYNERKVVSDERLGDTSVGWQVFAGFEDGKKAEAIPGIFLRIVAVVGHSSQLLCTGWPEM